MRGILRSSYVQCGAVVAAMFVGAAGAPSAARAANVLANPGFETPSAAAGDVGIAPGSSSWNGFNGAFITAATQHTGAQAGKAFGNPGGMYQDFAATPGQTWSGTVFAENLASDPLAGPQGGFINIEWHDAANNTISFLSTPIVNSASPTNTWTLGSVSGVAPAGTTTARLVLLSGPYTGLPGNAGGAAYFDDATFQIVPEPASLGAAVLLGGMALIRRRRGAN
jgi:hypothetical protein